jgi:NADH:ubiquinone oxidoreductase subunit E
MIFTLRSNVERVVCGQRCHAGTMAILIGYLVGGLSQERVKQLLASYRLDKRIASSNT